MHLSAPVPDAVCVFAGIGMMNDCISLKRISYEQTNVFFAWSMLLALVGVRLSFV